MKQTTLYPLRFEPIFQYRLWGDLAEAAERIHIFARLSPGHNQRIIRALQKMQHVVGFHDDLTANHLLHVYIFPPAKSNTSPATAP